MPHVWAAHLEALGRLKLPLTRMQPENALAQLRRNQRVLLVTGVVALLAAPLVVIGVTLLSIADSYGTSVKTPTPTPDELNVGTRIAVLGYPAAALLAAFGALAMVFALRRKHRLDELEHELHSSSSR